MGRLHFGAGVLTVLVLAGGAACGGANVPLAAQPAESTHHHAATHKTGTIRGRFVIFGTMGRPGQAVDHPARGTLTFTSGRHRVLVIRVDRSGSFTVRLSPGTYRVYGRTPQLITVTGSGAQREDKVTLSHPVTVAAGHITKIAVRAIVP
jgi:hypothetical protein